MRCRTTGIERMEMPVHPGPTMMEGIEYKTCGKKSQISLKLPRGI
jgi:hypothetical protein